MTGRKKQKRSREAAASVRQHVQCPICYKWYSSKKSLKIHDRIHTGYKPHCCHLCPKRFSQANVLKAHINAHLGRRNYVCSVCLKAFVQSAHLRTHEQTHNKSKKFQCCHCARTFCSKATRERHVRRHAGEKPFSCPSCSKRFSRRETLRAHERAQHSAPAVQLFCRPVKKPSRRSNRRPVHRRRAIKKKEVEDDVSQMPMPGPLPVGTTDEASFQATETAAALTADLVKQEEDTGLEITIKMEDNETEINQATSPEFNATITKTETDEFDTLPLEDAVENNPMEDVLPALTFDAVNETKCDIWAGFYLVEAPGSLDVYPVLEFEEATFDESMLLDETIALLDESASQHLWSLLDSVC